MMKNPAGISRLAVLAALGMFAVSCAGSSVPGLVDDVIVPDGGGADFDPSFDTTDRDVLSDAAPVEDPGVPGDAASADTTQNDTADLDTADPEDLEPSPDAVPGDAGPQDSGPVDPGISDGAEVPDDGQSDAFEPEAPPPDGPGPYTWTTESTTVRRGGREIPAVVYLPQDVPGGALPVVLFIPGFQTDSSKYAGTLERIASYGFVVVRCDPPDPLTSVDHREMAADVSAVLDWTLGDSSAALVADPGRVAVMGHSLGGKVATMAAFRDDRFGALFGIDPVNGGGPTGYADSRPDIVPDEVEALVIPVGFVGETTNGSGTLIMPACAPSDQNFQTFFDAATAAPWAAEWDFAGADHMDFLDVEACDWLCRLACAQGSAGPEAVVAGTRALAVAFLRRHLRAETSMDAWLVGESVPADVGVRARP
jgi:pimeloyl-ACP methyl ester carboxylesterase